jgi:hypothetical protein
MLGIMSRTGKGSKTVSVILPEEIQAELIKYAKAKDWSVSQAAKNLIIRGLATALISGEYESDS